jgi:hypothetical protein
MKRLFFPILVIAGCSATDTTQTSTTAISAITVRTCPTPIRTITAGASIQSALNSAQPGDVVVVPAGVHHEAVTFPRSGTATGCIALKGDPGAILDGTGAGGNVGVTIDDKSFVAVTGLTIQNYRGGDTPTGIRVTGGPEVVEIRSNHVSGIQSRQDAHGISFYGTAASPIRDLTVDGNEVSNCKLGTSESMVLNGNVTNFVVSHNVVHDNDNIGIDFIGFEGTGPSGQDQARGGICVDNVVYNISSKNNPSYGGDLSADGIYVDGGKDIVIERNRVSTSDIGIEIASEHGGKTTSDITVRNNIVSGSAQGDLMVGGYDASRGAAKNITFVQNTLFKAKGGEVIVQFNTSDVLIANNIMVGATYVTASGNHNSSIVVDTNLYFGGSTSSAGTWADTHALFADPKLTADLHLGAGSPAIDKGSALGERAGATDIDGDPRMVGPALDLGADEATSHPAP